jgi:gamma-glutamyl hercynylcysteine S-oxide synthase
LNKTAKRQLRVIARQLCGAALAQALVQSRARTWSLVNDLTPAQWHMPHQSGVNPVAWELAHLAWFAEFWILRGPHRVNTSGFTEAARGPQHAGPDWMLDSAQLAHAARWQVELPSRERVKKMLDGQLQACLEALVTLAAIGADDDEDALYPFRLALFHEDMHGEAFHWMRFALGYAAPVECVAPSVTPSHSIQIPAQTISQGLKPDTAGFAFDNEMPGFAQAIGEFEIDSAPLSAGHFMAFVQVGGYQQPHFWPGPAAAWLERSGQRHPVTWRKHHSVWQMRWFDQWHDFQPARPMMHVNAFEAAAYCLWAGRQLPSAAQWQAATGDAQFSWGHSVWEWTRDVFMRYPGFLPGPYREYSAPWFGDHQELRGGAFATHARMHHRAYRNFFQPHRNDVFAGFRTVNLG